MSGRKKAIFSISLGSDPAYKYSEKSISEYARRVGADFFNITSPIYKNILDTESIAWTALFQKMHFKSLLTQYDSVLYMDADLIVTPNAPNIFMLFSNDSVWMLNEGHRGREQAIAEVSRFFDYDGNWSKTGESLDYFNAGVIFAAKESKFQEYIDFVDCEKTIRAGISYLEQSYFNFVIQNNQVKVGQLPKEFNYMENVGSADERFSAAFIHYAGNGFRKKGQKRYQVIRSDFFQLYGKPDGFRYVMLLVSDYFNYKKVSLARNYKRLVRRFTS